MATFDPEHKKFVVPPGLKEGDTQKLLLDDGRTCMYTLPRGSKPGETHIIRADHGTKKMMLRIEKPDASTRLGLIMWNKGDEKHPVCKEVRPDGAASGIVLPGDVLLTVSVDLPVPKAIEATSLHGTAELLRAATGIVRIAVMRPQPAPPSRVLHSGFMHKRSPKSLIGVHAWQNRWFELSPTRITYWELALHSAQADLDGQIHFFLGEQRGTIALADMAGVREDRSNLRRIDILMKNKRMFVLAVPSAEDRQPWCEALRQALLDALSAAAEGVSLEPAGSLPEPRQEKDEVEDSLRDEGEDQPALDGADVPPVCRDSSRLGEESSLSI
ncbi:hypothetical protein AB1Y20_005784 [Prymnesium parvum]|uniref:PH domain-containing protein n=1 Tax=Prymnesium parvum TaxID=97485 RepID=A0AB34IZU9_PRYPA